MIPTASPSRATSTRRAALSAYRIELTVDVRRAQLPLLEQPVIAQHEPVIASTRPSAPRPASEATSTPAATLMCDAAAYCDDRARDRMLRIAARLRRPARRSRARRMPFKVTTSTCRRPAGQRASLVERHAPYAARALEMRAALDEHALVRGARERRHNRHRRGDHERAGARDDQQHRARGRSRLSQGPRRTTGATTATATASTMTAGV